MLPGIRRSDGRKLGRGFAWLDTGTHESLLRAANYVETLEQRQGIRIASPEETAFEQGWIGTDDLIALADQLDKSGYGGYLRELAEHGVEE